MKKSVLFILFMISCTLLPAQSMTEMGEKVKRSKMIIALTEYPKKVSKERKMMIDSANSALRFAMKNYWEYSELAIEMPLSEAKEFVENSEGYCYISIDRIRRAPTAKKKNVSYISEGDRLSIYTPKKAISAYFSFYEGAIPKVTVVYATTFLDKTLKLLHEKEYTSSGEQNDYIKKNGPNMIKKTLLFPKEYISPKLSLDDFKLAYPYEVDFCDLEKVDNAILNRDAKYAVANYVPILMFGKVVFYMYLTSAEDGDFYGYFVIGNSTADYISIQDYLITKKQLKQLRKIVE